MFLAEIGTAGVISAYFFRHFTSGYSLNVSDPIEGQPVQLSDYLCFFGFGLVFWLLVLLRAKLYGSGDRQADIRYVAKQAKLITPITTLNLCGSLLAPFMKLPLLVRFLVLFQVSSNLALLLIWAFLSLKECMILLDAHTQQQQKSSPEPQAVHGSLRSLPKSGGGCCGNLSKSRGGYRGYLRFSGQIKRILPKFSSVIGSSTNYEGMPDYPLISSSSADSPNNTVRANSAKNSGIIQAPIAMQHNTVRAKSAKNIGIRQIPIAMRADSQRNTVRANSAKNSAIIQMPIAMQEVARCEGMPVAVHEVDLVSGKVDEAGGSGSGDGSGASGREENRGRYGGNDGGGGEGGGGDRGASGSGHGSGASGSGENSGGYGGHGRDEGGTGSGHGSGASGSGENSGGYGGHGRDEGGTGSGHGSGASGSGENRGRSEGGDRGRDGGGVDPENGERETNTEQAFRSSKITEISLMLTGQTLDLVVLRWVSY